MTGFGRANRMHDDMHIIVEVRSLNSKLADVRIKTLAQLGHWELDLRRLILDSAVRGKIDVAIEIKREGLVSGVPDVQAIKEVYSSLKSVADDLRVDDSSLFSTVLRLPGITSMDDGALDEQTWSILRETIEAALEKLADYRNREGVSLHQDLGQRVRKISELLKAVDRHEDDRSETLRGRLKQRMHEIEQEAIDQNRFEQEILYYMDKLDVHEEKVRLAEHCDHFLEILDAPGNIKGKKLTFVSQEIGREINTLGAKAQWSPIQRIVVQMKDELEKTKEQLANVL